MKEFFNKFLFKDPSRWQFWVILAFLFKGLIFILLLCRYKTNPDGFWGLYGGDSESYMSPIRHLIAHSIYSPDYRMPGYGIIYFPLALFLSTPTAYNVIIILQFVVAALTVYPLALITRYLFKSDSVFYLTFYLYAVSIYSNMYDGSLYTESFTTSFLILSVFFLMRALMNEPKRTLSLLLSGLFLTEVIFLRPVFFPMILLFPVVLLVYFIKQQSARKIATTLLIFLLPFLFFDGLWTMRNYLKYQKVIPSTRYIYYPEISNSYYLPLMNLVRSWGGNDQWDPNAEIRWFGLNDGLPAELHNVQVTIPSYVYTSKFNYDSLVVLRKQLLNYTSNDSNPNADSVKQKALLATIRFKCSLYANSIKREKPFLYFVIAPILRIRVFLIHSGTYNLFETLTNQLPPLLYFVKIFYSLFYLLILIFGVLGIVLLLRKGVISTPIILVTGIVIYTIVIHPIILGMCEKRYFVPEYPFMLICAAYALNWLKAKLYVKRTF